NVSAKTSLSREARSIQNFYLHACRFFPITLLPESLISPGDPTRNWMVCICTDFVSGLQEKTATITTSGCSQRQSMHVLVTTDTISGVWSYTRELVSGLVSRGLQVTLVSFGEVPLPEQTSWMESLHGLDYRPTAFRLEWMQESEHDYRDSCAYLQALVE